ncbi:MAG TPA: arginase family protein, partial [Marmoricola sp.]|nr:arginase family protein [Marmoricola sp.]
DLRSADQPTSGTPFRQIASAEAAAGRAIDYTVYGIARCANTLALFDDADALGVTYVEDIHCTTRHLDGVLTSVAQVLKRAEVVHLSIDLDVLAAGVAPGVSAPAAFGVPLEVVLAICELVASSHQLTIVDIAELNPTFDIDGRTARVAARLIDTITNALP